MAKIKIGARISLTGALARQGGKRTNVTKTRVRWLDTRSGTVSLRGIGVVVVLKLVVVVLERVGLAVVVVQGLETLQLDGTVHLGYLRPRNCVAMKSLGAQSAGKNAVM